MSLKSMFLAGAAVAALAAGVAGAGAASASASASVPFVPGVTARPLAPAVYKAVTRLTARPDGGNGGVWATDTITRTLTITVAGTPGHYADTATVTDTGMFTLAGGALAPNQSVPGTRITAHPQVLFTQVTGSAAYSFTASSLPSAAPNLGVPAAEAGAPVTPGQSTSSWYLQAFPVSAAVSPGGITTWGWDYTAFVNSRGALRIQQWADTSSNGDGDLPGDGNITG